MLLTWVARVRKSSEVLMPTVLEITWKVLGCSDANVGDSDHWAAQKRPTCWREKEPALSHKYV